MRFKNKMKRKKEKEKEKIFSGRVINKSLLTICCWQSHVRNIIRTFEKNENERKKEKAKTKRVNLTVLNRQTSSMHHFYWKTIIVERVLGN